MALHVERFMRSLVVELLNEVQPLSATILCVSGCVLGAGDGAH